MSDKAAIAAGRQIALTDRMTAAIERVAAALEHQNALMAREMSRTVEQPLRPQSTNALGLGLGRPTTQEPSHGKQQKESARRSTKRAGIRKRGR